MRFNNEFAIRKAAASMEHDFRCMNFGIRPSQAALLWWGLKHLEKDMSDAIAHNVGATDYPETLRNLATAIEWCRTFQGQLGSYAHKSNMEVAP